MSVGILSVGILSVGILSCGILSGYSTERCTTDDRRLYIGAIQVLRNADGGGGGVRIPRKKALRRHQAQRYLALRGGGWGSNFQEKSVT